MPAYDFACEKCGLTVTMTVRYEDRLAGAFCDCGGTLEYQFPLSAARGIRLFDPYYDEGLGIDVTGLRMKREYMKVLGVIEAGDRVGGARNEDKKYAVGKQPPKGITLKTIDDHRRLEDKVGQEGMNIGIRKSDGTMTHWNTNDLPSR